MEDSRKEDRGIDNSYSAILKRFVYSGTNADTDIFNKLLIEPIALPTIWFLLNFTSVTANQITFLGLFGGLFGALIFTVTQNLWWVAGGYLFSFLCDYMDGAIAEGRGGGTYFGAIIDLVSDRTVTLFSVISLAYYHKLQSDAASNFLLVVYVSIFYLYDIIAHATLRAKVSYNRLTPPVVAQPEERLAKTSPSGQFGGTLPPLDERTWLGNFFRPRVWIPVFLTSQLLAIISYCLYSSFSVAYGVAIFCGLCEFLVLGAKLARKYRLIPFFSNGLENKSESGEPGNF